MLVDEARLAAARSAIRTVTARRTRRNMLAGYAARCAVQRGLADVLEWLGERPLPWPPVTGSEVLEGFRRGLI